MYIAFFNNKNHQDCLNLANQIDSKNNTLLCIFENQSSFMFYNLKIIEKGHKCLVIDNLNFSPIQLLKDFLNKRLYFAFLNKTNIVIRDLDNYINHNKNSGIICLTKNKEIILTLISTDTILSLPRNILCDTIIYNPNKLSNVQHNKITNNVVDFYNPENYINNDDIPWFIGNAYYENNRCIFSIFEGVPGIWSSPCVVNKQNNKVYNINNNIAGIANIQKDQISIVWTLDNRSEANVTYFKNNDRYIPIK